MTTKFLRTREGRQLKILVGIIHPFLSLFTRAQVMAHLMLPCCAIAFNKQVLSKIIKSPLTLTPIRPSS